MRHQERFREREISETTYYQWKSKYGTMEAADIRRLPDLEAEHPRSKQVYVDHIAENGAPKDLNPSSN